MPTVSQFQLGHIVVTASVLDWVQNIGGMAGATVVQSCLTRHASCDWGDLDEHDLAQNEYAFGHGERLMSAYRLDSLTLYVITEADRSVTTILQPEDY